VNERVFVHSTNHKGAIAEAVVAAEAIKLGIVVLKPIAEHTRYDLAFDLDGRILRVQCKWANLKGNVIYVHLAGYRLSARGSVRSTYASHEIDAVAVYCGDLGQVYLLPVDLVADRTALHLRLRPPNNAQRAAINWAAQYELSHGAVAQLARAPRWHRGGQGFESPQLHCLLSSSILDRNRKRAQDQPGRTPSLFAARRRSRRPRGIGSATGVFPLQKETPCT